MVEVQEEQEKINIVIVTGMSGAGRSLALSALEDFGYFCVDNLPPAMIEQIASLTLLPDSAIKRIAIACDIRGGKQFYDLLDELDDEDLAIYNPLLLYLDANDATLVNRF